MKTFVGNYDRSFLSRILCLRNDFEFLVEMTFVDAQFEIPAIEAAAGKMRSYRFSRDQVVWCKWSICTHHDVGIEFRPVIHRTLDSFYARNGFRILGIDVFEKGNLLHDVVGVERRPCVDVLLAVRQV